MIKRANVLLYGNASTGKSFCLATLFKLRDIRPDQRVVVVATERNAISGLLKGLDVYGIELQPKQLYFAEIRPASKKAFKTKLHALKEYSKATTAQLYAVDKNSNDNRDKYGYFVKVLEQLMSIDAVDYKTKEEVNLGNIADLGSEDILIVDGLSPFVQGLWDLCKGDRIVTTQADYGQVQGQLMSIIYELVNSVECSLIMLAHEEVGADGNTYPALNAGQAIYSKFVGNFSEVIYTYRTMAGKYVWTGKKAKITTAPRSFPAEDNLVPDFSLYNIFRDDGKM